jgi:hypothetical protein
MLPGGTTVHRRFGMPIEDKALGRAPGGAGGDCFRTRTERSSPEPCFGAASGPKNVDYVGQIHQHVGAA